MAWTAKLLSKNTVGAVVEPIVEFTDGTRTFTENYRADDIDRPRLEARVRARIAALDAQAATLAALPAVGSLAIPAIPTPTQAETDAAAFFTSLDRANRLQAAANKGILPAAGVTALAGLKATLTTNFLEVYTLDPRWR